MDAIMDIAKKHQLNVIEDCAQSHGATYKNQMTGSFGDIGCFSFYPTKNLGAVGDGGAMVTNDKDLDRKLRMMRNFGSEKKYHHEIEGINSRLDEIQAAMLSVKLKYLDEMNKERQKIASYYLSKLNNPILEIPKTAPHNNHVYHLFVIKTSKRDELIQYLEDHNIKTQIHYPFPPYLETRYNNLGFSFSDFPKASKSANLILSLPLYIGITYVELKRIVNSINNFKS
jgi:dTDP-4-amino-4,6-dideoxygalactose transaminase